MWKGRQKFEEVVAVELEHGMRTMLIGIYRHDEACFKLIHMWQGVNAPKINNTPAKLETQFATRNTWNPYFPRNPLWLETAEGVAGEVPLRLNSYIPRPGGRWGGREARTERERASVLNKADWRLIRAVRAEQQPRSGTGGGRRRASLPKPYRGAACRSTDAATDAPPGGAWDQGLGQSP